MRDVPTVPRPCYDAVLCDIDGVLRHWPSLDALDLAHGLPAGALAAAAFAPHRLHPAITGQVTDEQWRSAIATDLIGGYGPAVAAQAAVAAWSSLRPRIDAQVVALLMQVRSVATLALVSNATTRLEHDLEREGLAGLADIVVNSARIGVAKPDRRVYLIAAERAAVPPGRCLFIDDTEANVTAARQAGMIAIHYRQFDDIRNVPGCSAGWSSG
jgi:putative hydrolase of the HAD superfamily